MRTLLVCFIYNIFVKYPDIIIFVICSVTVYYLSNDFIVVTFVDDYFCDDIRTDVESYSWTTLFTQESTQWPSGE